jgi:hypothetical protein
MRLSNTGLGQSFSLLQPLEMESVSYPWAVFLDTVLIWLLIC